MRDSRDQAARDAEHESPPVPESPAGLLGARSAWSAISATPARLPGPFRRPGASYGAALLVVVAGACGSAMLAWAVPSFTYRDLLPLALIALSAGLFGTLPALLSTPFAAGLLVALAPAGALARGTSFPDLVLFLLTGAGISLAVGSAVERAAAATARLQAARGTAEEAGARAERLEAILDAVPDIISVHDATGGVVQLNGAGRRYATSEEETVALARAASAYVLHAATGKVVPPMHIPVTPTPQSGKQFPSMIMHLQDGEGYQRYLSMSVAPWQVEHGGAAGMVAVTRDITERRRLERRTHEALTALLAMAEALVTPSRAPAPEGPDAASPVLHRLVELTRRVLGCRTATLLGLDPASLSVTSSDSSAIRPSRGLPSASIVGLSLADVLGSASLTTRLHSGEVLTLGPSRSPMAGGTQILASSRALVAPLRRGLELIGALHLEHADRDHEYNPDEVALAGAVAKLAALVIERDALLEERAEGQAREMALRETNRRMVEFLSISGHELRTPLSVIQGYIQLAQRRVQGLSLEEHPSAAELQAALEAVAKLLVPVGQQTAQLNRLIDDLLDISRIQAGRLSLRLRPIDLIGLVREVVEVQCQAHPDRTIQVAIAEAGPVTVQADADRLTQVLTNFLTNAVKYAPPGPPIEVGLDLQPDWARVWVRDQGPGLRAEDLQQVWDRFYRTAAVSHQITGLGLGLFISRGIIEQHGGEVGVDSVPGQGATFWFTLPVPRAPEGVG